MGLALQCAPVWTSTPSIVVLTEHTLWVVSDSGSLLCHVLLEYAPTAMCMVPRGEAQGSQGVHNVVVGACPPLPSHICVCAGLAVCTFLLINTTTTV